MKKAALHNLGCKVNGYETEAMQELLVKNGYEIVPFQDTADVYIVNTCTVTNVADRKSRQMLHRARKKNPDAVVVACGCYVQAKQGELDESVDIVIGNNRKKDLIEILKAFEENRQGQIRSEAGRFCDRRVELADINRVREYEELKLESTAEHTRVYVKVQDGCNQFCSYCIIPYARGRVRSRSRDSVTGEVRRLADNGYKEVVLTGIHLSSYGVDTGDSLLGLILAIHEIPGIRRIRLGSLEPGIITEEFTAAIAKLPKICPHFHLSLQSGCDATLKRMNRRYTSGEYYEKCTLLRKYFARPALTTDVIVGFPGETEEEYAKSRAFIDKVDFYETHVFKYSKRTGTRAAMMENQVPEEIKNRRSSDLLALGRRKRGEYEEELIGTVQEVLMEEDILVEGERYQVGHTREYVKVGQKTDENRVNQIVNVEIKNRLQIMH
ncbi:tRNA (N(6)-L-threonylcarbamoyladenosine(37)-C(2))-methylthiotransferase MtaB [Sporofaciens sp. JLR.KK001]|jgi:threonylcarbamoyladenosine tRNA methylthiotransferase MtaB|uniref:tRNA (N(6)-L-threonylcarbamoyladenosine(37)-C(2))- methylthiotransferase MtaB n=1 Tax=Sporofaciens sp. JLR.KK001 TaxID=3112621 RepID=UPI002FF34092